MTWLDDRITATQDLIEKYESAISFLAANPNKSYSIDTGQTTWNATSQDIGKLNEQLDLLYERYERLIFRRDGSNTTVVAPIW